MFEEAIVREFLSELKLAFETGALRKISLGNATGIHPELKQVLIRSVLIRNENLLGFTYRYRTRDITKNYTVEEAIEEIINQLPGFRIIHFKTSESEREWEILKNGKTTFRKKNLADRVSQDIPRSHDRSKPYLMEAKSAPFLHDLGICSKDGNVFHSAYDKFRQINHYIALLAPELNHWKENTTLQIADMGSGKGYLTFALYHYLTQRQYSVEMTGYETRADLIEFCRKTAGKHQMAGLHFEEADIADARFEKLDVLIALHACDTATDLAIEKGIRAEASIIVVAPCCHKEVRREMKRTKKFGSLKPALHYGLFLERQAEMLTDTLRALVLEYFGYEVKIIEFVSTEHTPKNLMILAVRKESSPRKKEMISEQIQTLMTDFGIETQCLVHRCGCLET
ncbi:MAG TPA: SAM-dependent methyltransferase [Chitinophagaceae bacterium]|nr:SAM-dependent methyltransferase [Chitinophagaceae bacterium]